MGRRTVWVVMVMVMVLAGAWSARAQAPSARPTVTPEQAAEARELLARLRFADPLQSSTAELVAQMLQLGDHASQQLAGHLERDIVVRQDRYLRDFERAAAAALKARRPRDAESKAQALRHTVIALGRSQTLTADQIRGQSDPAMKELAALFTIGRVTVLDADERLLAARRALLAQVRFHEQAAAAVPKYARPASPRIDSADAYEQMIARRETLAALMATPMTADDRRVMLANQRIAADMDPQEAAGIEMLNVMRLQLGLGALLIDAKLCDASRDHSQDMRTVGFFAHESPVAGKTTPWDRASNFGTTAQAENIYAGSRQGASAIEAWWYSPGHHRNMLGTFRRVGMGHSEGHWTQMFGG